MVEINVNLQRFDKKKNISIRPSEGLARRHFVVCILYRCTNDFTIAIHVIECPVLFRKP